MIEHKPDSRVSVVIPHWNNYPVLKECLVSLTETSWSNLEVIIVDNGSHDGSPDLVEKDFPQFKVFRNEKNEGYAGGCNRGSELATGEYILFLNNDTVHDPDWIDRLVLAIESQANIAAVQPKILNYFNRENFDYAGGAGGHLDIFAFPVSEGRVFTEIEKDFGQYDKKTPIFWSSGTGFLIRKDAFFAMGKFDETFFAHMEEIDLCWRLHLAGYDVLSCPDAKIYHRNAATLPMYTHKKYYLNHRNSLLMTLANYNLATALYLYPLRVGLEALAAFYALVKMDFPHFTAVIRAQLWLLTHPVTVIRKRKRVKRLRKVNDRFLMKKMIRKPVVFEYYLFRKKTWKEISHSRQV